MWQNRRNNVFFIPPTAVVFDFYEAGVLSWSHKIVNVLQCCPNACDFKWICRDQSIKDSAPPKAPLTFSFDWGTIKKLNLNCRSDSKYGREFKKIRKNFIESKPFILYLHKSLNCFSQSLTLSSRPYFESLRQIKFSWLMLINRTRTWVEIWAGRCMWLILTDWIESKSIWTTLWALTFRPHRTKV